MLIETLSFSVPWSRDAFIEELSRNTLARYLSAKIDERVVGYAGMWKVLDEAHITNIAVHPEFRRNNIGYLLLESLIQLARRECVQSMTLEVRKNNIIAQGLYKKYGFKEVGVRKGYYSDNDEDAIIMWKKDIQNFRVS